MLQRIAAHRILVVDRDEAAARALADRLPGFGYDVAGIASSGAEAIALTAGTRPSLVLMSLALGDADGDDNGDGAEAAARAAEIRERWAIPVVFLTAAADAATLERVNITGSFGYVASPFPDRELRMNIEMALYEQEMKRRSHEMEDRFFVASIDMLCFLDFSGYFKRLNPAWERALGFSREELMSRPFIEFVHPDDRARTLAQNKAVRAGGQANSFENRYLCKDGSYRWLLWNAASDTAERTIYSVARDITDRKRGEEEREALVRELQTALAEVQTLQKILPICSYCKNIRDDKDYWQTVESYISRHTSSRFSHSICPTCFTNRVEPELDDLERE